MNYEDYEEETMKRISFDVESLIHSSSTSASKTGALQWVEWGPLQKMCPRTCDCEGKGCLCRHNEGSLDGPEMR